MQHLISPFAVFVVAALAAVSLVAPPAQANTPPDVVISYPQPQGLGWGPHEGYVMGGFGDPDEGDAVERVDVSVDGGAWQTAEMSWFWQLPVTLAAGTHTATARAWDGESFSEEVTTTFDVEDQDPTIGLTTPVEGDQFECYITVSGVARDTGGSGIIEVVYMVNGARMVVQGHFPAGEVPFSWTLGPWGPNSPTDMLIQVQARDGSNNPSNVAQAHVTRLPADCISRTTIDLPGEGATVSELAWIEGHVTIPEGRTVEHVHLWLGPHDLGTVGLDDDGTSWIYPLDTTLYADDTYALHANAYETGYGYAIGDYRTVTIDNSLVLPTVVITSPGHEDVARGVVTVGGHLLEPGLHADRVDLFLSGTPLGSAGIRGGSWLFTFDSRAFESGEHWLHATPYVEGHGYGYADEVSFRVDNGYVENLDLEGRVACSAATALLRAGAPCGGEDIEAPVGARLTAARFELTWDEGPIDDLDDLGLVVRVGEASFGFDSEGGSLVAEVEAPPGEPFTSEASTASFHVHASAANDLPNVAFDQKFELRVTWAYFGAPLP